MYPLKIYTLCSKFSLLKTKTHKKTFLHKIYKKLVAKACLQQIRIFMIELKVANYFCKTLHHRCSTGFWICLWSGRDFSCDWLTWTEQFRVGWEDVSLRSNWNLSYNAIVSLNPIMFKKLLIHNKMRMKKTERNKILNDKVRETKLSISVRSFIKRQTSGTMRHMVQWDTSGTSGTTRHIEWQHMITSDSEWQWVTLNGRFD